MGHFQTAKDANQWASVGVNINNHPVPRITSQPGKGFLATANDDYLTIKKTDTIENPLKQTFVANNYLGLTVT